MKVLTKKAETDGIGPAGDDARKYVTPRFTPQYLAVHGYVEDAPDPEPPPPPPPIDPARDPGAELHPNKGALDSPVEASVPPAYGGTVTGGRNDR